MEFDKYDYAAGLILGISVIITAIGFTELSGEIAVHFNAEGQPDNYMPLIPGLLFLPLLSAGLLIIFEYLPSLDPLGDNYESFEDMYEILKLLIIGILTYIQGLLVFWNLGVEYNITLMIVPVIFSAYYLAGKIMEKAEKNWFVGIRNPWTLSSDRVWNETHKKTAPLMKISALISVVALVAPEYSMWLFVAPVLMTVIFSTFYSYLLYSDEN